MRICQNESAQREQHTHTSMVVSLVHSSEYTSTFDTYTTNDTERSVNSKEETVQDQQHRCRKLTFTTISLHWIWSLSLAALASALCIL